MIPKLLHFIWLGSKLPSRYREFLDSWRQLHPSWGFRLWSEQDLASLSFLNLEQYRKAPNFGAKSDILRYAILYEFGGVYADTDFLCLRPFDELVQQYNFFAGKTVKNSHALYNALIGAKVGHPILEKVLAAVQVDDWSAGSVSTFENTGPALLSRVATAYIEDSPQGVGLLEFDYFYSLPNSFSRATTEVPWRDYLTDNSYAVHFWDTSWLRSPWYKKLRAFLLRPFSLKFKRSVRAVLNKLFSRPGSKSNWWKGFQFDLHSSETRLATTQSVSRRPPKLLLQESDYSLFESELLKVLAPVWIRNSSNTRVYWNGSGSSANGFGPRLKKFVLALSSRKSTNAKQEELWLVTDKFSHNYFHWLADVLPKFELLLAHGVEIEKLTLLLPFKINQSYVTDSLQIFGIRCVVRIEEWRYVRPKNLRRVSELGVTGNYRPELLVALRQRFVAAVNKEASTQALESGPIYISRAGASRRKLANEAALTPIFERHGVRCLRLEDLTFFEQVRLFANTKLAIGLHGAGLSNCMWMAPGTAMFELRFRGDGHSNCYFSLASAMGQDYYYMLVDSTRVVAQAATTMDTHLDDAIVDPKLFEEVLVHILSGE